MARTSGLMRPSKFRLPESTAAATSSPRVTASATASGSGPLLPMQLWTPTVPATNECTPSTDRSKTRLLPARRRSSTFRAIVGKVVASFSTQ